jgi:predicted transcriptional regulator
VVKVEEIASSRVRLRISDLLSSRPATLGELSALTGVSVQAVLKHLKKLDEEGILEEKTMKAGKYLKQRKLYYMSSRKIADYSEGELLVATLSRPVIDARAESKNADEELEWLAQDVVILRRRARELSHRMKRVLEEISEDQARIGALVDGLALSPEEKQIAYLIFAEDTPERARAVLREHYGCRDPEAAMRAVAAKVGRKTS